MEDVNLVSGSRTGAVLQGISAATDERGSICNGKQSAEATLRLLGNTDAAQVAQWHTLQVAGLVAEEGERLCDVLKNRLGLRPRVS